MTERGTSSVRSHVQTPPSAIFFGLGLGLAEFIPTSTSSRNRSRKRNVDPETVLPRTGLIRGTPEKPSAHIYIYIYIYMYVTRNWVDSALDRDN